MQKLAKLNRGDSVEIIAPASRCTDQHLLELKELLSSWGLNCLVSPEIFGDDLLCANTDEIRFRLLKDALLNPETKAIICARGGYGSMRLIPKLSALTPPHQPKLFLGMSDITALHLYLQQAWHWPVIHGALAKEKFSAESIAATHSLLFDSECSVKFSAVPLNKHAEKNDKILASVTGGNLCLIQSSLGTLWQIDSRHKIIFLEEINERGYRVDRMLEQLQQAGIFQHASAIVFGDFLGGNEPDGSSLIQPILERFALECKMPVLQIKGIGHGHVNFPMPFGTLVELNLGKQPTIIW